jgi:hypothetical protein
MISSSAEYRSLATMDTVLRSASQQAISQVGQQSALFASCESAGPSGPGQVTFSLPAGYTAVVSSVQYWNASATPPAFNPPSTWLGTSFSPCLPNAPALLTITVTAASSGASSSIRSVVDEQQASSVTGAGAATQLVFLTEPGNGTAGSNLSPEPAVAVEDANGNIVYTDLSDVQLTISGGSGATLSDTCTGSEFYGVVTFSDCSINMAGTGYSLRATDGALHSATSTIFNVTAGVATQAAITSAPFNVVPASWASGNPTTSASAIAVTLSSTTPGGGTAEFAASSGGSSLDSVSLPANTRTVTDYNAYSEGLKSPVITASTGMTSGTQTETT